MLDETFARSLVEALEDSAAGAAADYLRIRAAYLELARSDDPNEVALAMVGSDLEAAFSRLQSMTGLSFLEYSTSACAALREEARRAMHRQDCPSAG